MTTIRVPCRDDGSEIMKTTSSTARGITRDCFANAPVQTTTQYLQGGYQYIDGNLAFVPHAEGFVKMENGVMYFYNYTDHLGNVRATYTDYPDAGGVQLTEESHYYPFGLKHQGYNTPLCLEEENGGPCISTLDFMGYKYKYNGKELQDELGLNMYDYGARNYDPALGRWMNIDPKADSYFSFSPYNYVMNNPMYFVDPFGEDVYLFYYLRNNHKNGEKDKDADKMFWQAAMTRANDFLNSEGGKNDIMVMRGIDDMSDIEGAVEGDVAKYSETYGKTAEFGLWSHSGLDGPFRENKDGSYDQLSLKDWSKIDFNWSNEAKAGFYGCRSGKDPDVNESRSNNGKSEYSFAQNASSLANFENVNVWGQTERSWPSSYTNVRSTDNTGSIYMVGSKKAFSGVQNFIGAFNHVVLRQNIYAYPMAIFRKGKFINNKHQPGPKK